MVVIRDNEWDLLKPHYSNGFFFSSHAYQESEAISIEMKHIYRQEPPVFINILNEIRNNALSDASANELNKRFVLDFIPEPDAGNISLTTHNNKADATNHAELAKMKTKILSYKAKIDGKFPDHAYPAKENLELKVGPR